MSHGTVSSRLGSTSTPAREKESEVEKDEEELDLEEALFGRSKKRRRAAAPASNDVDDEGVNGHDLGNIEDDALFSIDAAEFGEEVSSDAGSDLEEYGSRDGDKSDPSIEFEAMSDGEGKDRPVITLPEDSAGSEHHKIDKEPLWTDPADCVALVSLNNDRRLRKLARGKQGDGNVAGKELESRLREQFERLHPKPKWADHRQRAGTPALSSLLASTTSFISTDVASGSRPSLPQGSIDIQRLRNANQQHPTTGKKEAEGAGRGVVDVAWHPSSRVGVLAVAGGDRRVRFFNVDGHTNATLLTLHIPALPLTKSTFHPSGSSLLLTGTRPFYYTYDLASQRCLRSARNLFGSVPSPTSPQSLTTHSFSPDGALLAVAGRRGCVTVIEWHNAGSSGAVVAELRSGRGGSISDLTWSIDGRELSVLGGRDGAEVEVWDVAERKINRKWSDDRAFGGACMTRNIGGDYTAIGSSTGIVNLYSVASLSRSSSSKMPSTTLLPEPIKSLEHLTTPISAMSFHPSGEVLAIASEKKRDAFRLYHLPSATAYSNWPTPATPLGRVTSLGFSSNGEYMAVGNTKGSVLLWGLKHYS